MKIALTQRVLYHKQRAYDSLEHGWYTLLKHHTLTFIPNFPNQDFTHIADTHDALIITGGDDSSLRRATEFKLATAMMNHGKLILGVCHGAFTLVDALGGIVTPDPNHMDCHHSILYKDQTIDVNSYHSQVISKLHTTGTGLAYDETGNCEAWIDGNVSGIVWHPERGDTYWLPSEISSTFGLQ